MRRFIILTVLVPPLLLVRCAALAGAPDPQMRAPQSLIVVRILATSPSRVLPTANSASEVQRIATVIVATSRPFEPTATAVATSTPIEPTDMSLDAMPPTETPAPIHSDSDGAEATSDVRTQLLDLHNQARAELGLPAYRMSLPLQQAAHQQADYLAGKPATELMRLGFAGHQGPNGELVATRAARVGYISNLVCENWGYFNSVQDVFDFWVTDPWHRPQVLSGDLDEVGFGISKHPEFGVVFVAVYGRQ